MSMQPTKPPFDRKNHCRQIGTLGGRKTAQTYGHKYMAELGRIGFEEYARKYHDGNRGAARAALKLLTHPDARR